MQRAGREARTVLAADKEFLIEVLVIEIASKAIVNDLCSKLCSASEER